MVDGYKTPIVDTSIGIVMRLNNYQIQADQFCSEGNFGAWNNILDIIFRTLNYEDQVEQIRDEETDKFIEVKFKDKEQENFLFFNKKINDANVFFNKAIKEYKGFRDDEYPENLSYEDVIEKFDSENTFFYVDPPYWQSENLYSFHSFNRESHFELADVLQNIKGKFLLSYYDYKELNDLYPKSIFNRFKKEYKRSSRPSKSNEKKPITTEMLVSNYNKQNLLDLFFK